MKTNSLILLGFIVSSIFYSCSKGNLHEQNYPYYELDSIIVCAWARKGQFFKVGRRLYPHTIDSTVKRNNIFLELIDGDTLYVVTDSPKLFGDTLSCIFYGNESLKNFFGQQLYDIKFWEDDIPYGAIVQNEKDTFLFGKNHQVSAPYELEAALIRGTDREFCGIKVGQTKSELFSLLQLSNLQNLNINQIGFTK